MTMYVTKLGKSIVIILVFIPCLAILKLTMFPQNQPERGAETTPKSPDIKRVRVQSLESLYIPQDFYAESAEEDNHSIPDTKINLSIQLEPKANNQIKANQSKQRGTTVVEHHPAGSVDSSSVEHTFHYVDEEETIVVYSAHHDQLTGWVKVIGFGPMHNDTDILKHYRCKIKREDGILILTAQLNVYYRITTYSPWEGQQYDSYIYTCGLTEGKPRSVTIVSAQDTTTEIKLPIEPRSTTEDLKYKLSVCVEPLVLNYNNTSLLKHFLAANTALGAEHFYFYLTSASRTVLEILTQLRDRVTVYRWPLGKLRKKTHAYGQKASNNHCLYAHRSQSRYLAYIDIDEVLVPNHGYSWSEMITKVNDQHPNNGAIIFQSKLFPSNQPTESYGEGFIDMISLSHTRTIGIFPYHRWSKVLLDAVRTDVMDIHHVRELLPPYNAVYENSSYGYIHHYRRFDVSSSRLYADDNLLLHKARLLATYRVLFPK